VDLRAERKNQYGGNVFNATAKIASALGLKEYDSRDVHIIFLAMKLARYRFQLQVAEDEDDFLEPDEETLCDSAEDAIVYLALMESQRRTKNGNHQKRQTRHSTKNV
jgi:hypothetical protein